MSSFPNLKTGAVMQYPAGRSVKHATYVCRFLDGKEQRYRELGAPLHRWVIQLDLLDEEEMTAVESFFQSVQGRYGDFSFIDPWDGTEYPSCSLEEDSIAMQFDGEIRSACKLVVRENRN